MEWLTVDHPKSKKEEDIEHTEPNFTRAKRSQLVLEATSKVLILWFFCHFPRE